MFKKQRRQQKITQLFIYLVTILSFFSSLIFGFLLVHEKLVEFRLASAKAHQNFLLQKKMMVRSEVEKAISYTQYSRSRAEQRLKNELRNRTHEAYEMASALFQRHQGQKSRPEIQQIIHDALFAVQWDAGRGYYFAEDMQGVERVNRNNPELEGTNIMDLQDSEGNYFVRDILAVAKNEGEGFCSYHGNKPGEPGVARPKYSYVKYFEPLDWVIGTGKNLDEVEKEIQQEVLQRLAEVRYGEDGYLFVGQWDGFILQAPAPAKGNNMWEITDPNGVKIIQECIRNAKQGGGFVEYVMPRLQGQEHKPKISFSMGVPEWQWFIGAGVYVDEIDALIAAEQQELKQDIKDYLYQTFLIFIVVVLLSVLVARCISVRIKSNLDNFFWFFDKAATQSVRMEPDEIYFSEFRLLAKSANLMIEEREQARQAFQESEERFQHAVENAPIPMFISNLDGRVEFLNQKFIETFGYSLEDIPTVEQWWTRAYPDAEHRRMVRKAWQRAMMATTGKNRLLPPQRWQVTCKDGLVRDIEFHYAQVGVRGVTTCNDLTEKLKTEREKNRLEIQLRHAQKLEAIGTMAGGIAHDFNNILTAVIGFADLAKYDQIDDEASKHIEEVLKAAHRAKELVKQILTFSRQGIAENMVPVNISLLINEALKLLRAATPSTIELHQEILPGCGSVLADPTQIHQILMNLCTNAVHAMEEKGGRLLVRLENVMLTSTAAQGGAEEGPGNFVQLTVSDTGHGIGPDIRERIFDPYFSTKDMGKGTGMGLAVVHGIVESLGGTIQLRSEVGKGSSFTVCLPRTEGAKLLPPKPETALPSGTERVLFVDDEEAIVSMAVQTLGKLGYKVTAFSSSEKALQAFAASPESFDIVLTDQTMPGLTGADLVYRLKGIRPNVPVVLCTGYSNLIDEESAQALGCKGFIMKPYTERILAKGIRQALAAPEVNDGPAA